MNGTQPVMNDKIGITLIVPIINYYGNSIGSCPFPETIIAHHLYSETGLTNVAPSLLHRDPILPSLEREVLNTGISCQNTEIYQSRLEVMNLC